VVINCKSIGKRFPEEHEVYNEVKTMNGQNLVLENHKRIREEGKRMGGGI
jgi:hypothetical protein